MLILEYIARLRALLPLQSLEASQFITLKVVNTVNAALEPAHGDGALCKVQIIPPQITGFAYPEPMPVNVGSAQVSIGVSGAGGGAALD